MPPTASAPATTRTRKRLRIEYSITFSIMVDPSNAACGLAPYDRFASSSPVAASRIRQNAGKTNRLLANSANGDWRPIAETEIEVPGRTRRSRLGGFGLGPGLQLLDRGQRFVRVVPGLLLAAVAAQEHRLALDRQLERLAHRAEQALLPDGAVF